MSDAPPPDVLRMLRDPLAVIRWLWPRIYLYDKQREMVMSVKNNGETYVPAGNKLGKDYTGGLIALGAFLFPQAFLLADDEPLPPASGVVHSVKIITTSVKDDHLDDLWGEMDRFVRTASTPLTNDTGGPLKYLHRELRKVFKGEVWRDSYLKAEVAKKGEARAGHHADFTLLIGDESSGLEDDVHSMGQGWARRMLFIGNPNTSGNFWQRAIEAGDLPMEDAA